MKNTWKLLNEVMNRKMKQRNFISHFNYNDNEIYDKQEIANGFNDFFVNIGPELANKIVIPENNDVLQYMNDRNVNSMFLYNVNKKEMLDVIKSFANKTSTDYNGMNMFILKKITNCIVDPFLHICNISFSKGVFPDALKIARVIPLFKSGDKHVFTNYRPVPLLPQFSKILEKLFNNRLDSFIEKNCILSECQYGFRNSRSTYMALMDLIENICETIDKKKYVMGIFIDLKKAFDTIDHNILSNKLYHYGMRGISNDWIKSYLENRKQFVQYDDAISDYKEILCGVPQGSILGPKLFILYINDICNISEIMKFVLFADDTNILCKHENYVSLCELVNIELSKLSKWFSINKLSLNVKKTSYMVFGNRHVNNNVKIRIDMEEIEKVYVTKFLGVYIDYRLDWKRHIDHIINKVS